MPRERKDLVPVETGFEATSIEVTPGETIVFAESGRETDETIANLHCAGKGRWAEQQVLLISVDVEQR